jgi:hypothetical protein
VDPTHFRKELSFQKDLNEGKFGKCYLMDILTVTAHLGLLKPGLWSGNNFHMIICAVCNDVIENVFPIRLTYGDCKFCLYPLASRMSPVTSRSAERYPHQGIPCKNSMEYYIGLLFLAVQKADRGLKFLKFL